MSRTATSFVLGYHGCDQRVGMRALARGLPLIASNKDYDWLGPGIYFWEGDPQRAAEWAEQKAILGSIAKPFVIGAVIDLGNCLDLLLRENLDLLSEVYKDLKRQSKKAGLQIPRNLDPRRVNKRDKLLRFRDCAVIRHLHAMIEDEIANPRDENHVEPFDTVRGLFVEGARTYSGGSFYQKTHTQIAVLNVQCIKGIFIPR